MTNEDMRIATLTLKFCVLVSHHNLFSSEQQPENQETSIKEGY